MKYAILTFGCRANQADSFDIDRDLRAAGGEPTAVDAADVVFINTCSVTSTAEQAARQAIRRVGRLNPCARIVATGCYATRQASELISIGAVVRGRDGVVSSDDAAPGVLAQEFSPVGPTARARMPGPGTRGRTIHLLRVQTGCDEACAYCVVPSTRGPSRSVPIEEVSREIDEAAAAGFKDVMITGVHLGSYGRDLRPASSLAVLLEMLDRHPADVRFRLSAIEPMDVGRDVVARLAASDRFARHFHLPLQHGSDRTLRAMGRPYSLEQYDAAVRALSERFADAAIGADVIVGFPGETEDDHERTVRYVEASPITYLHVFPFSPRPGTRAARTAERRPLGTDVRRRVAQLREIGRRNNKRFRERFIGTVRDGLTIEDGSLVLTDNYLNVRIEAGRGRNERVRVRIVEDGEPMKGTAQD